MGGTERENLSSQCNDDHNCSSPLNMDFNTYSLALEVASSRWTTPINFYFMRLSSMKNAQLWSFFKIRSSLAA